MSQVYQHVRVQHRALSYPAGIQNLNCKVRMYVSYHHGGWAPVGRLRFVTRVSRSLGMEPNTL